VSLTRLFEETRRLALWDETLLPQFFPHGLVRPGPFGRRSAFLIFYVVGGTSIPPPGRFVL